ncbi:MAG: hypothetical protein WC843_05875 [Candidatus Gracilibacteria bacterium]|jgi:hypothetical protein
MENVSGAPEQESDEKLVDEIIAVLSGRNVRSLNVVTLNMTLTSFRFTPLTMPELKKMVELLKSGDFEPIKSMLMKHTPGSTPEVPEEVQVVEGVRADIKKKIGRGGNGGARRGARGYTEIGDTE